MMSSVCMAGPLTDYSAGKVAIDVSSRQNTDLKVSDSTLGSGTFDGKNKMEYGVTIGLGNNFAMQYRKFNAQSKEYPIVVDNINGNLSGKLDTQEFNVLYKVDKNISAFVGVNKIQPKYTAASNGLSISSDCESKTNWQVGFMGQTELGDKLSAYASVAVGKDSNSWRIGTAYEINNNLDFDVFYAQNKYTNVAYSSDMKLLAQNNGLTTDKADYTIKGLGFGLTYKF